MVFYCSALMKSMLFFLWVLMPFAANAQFTTFTVVQGETSGGPACIINKKNPDNIIIASSAGVYFSADRGKTWQKSQIGKSGLEHALIADRKGDLYDFCTLTSSEDNGPDQIICQTSKDNGASWNVVGSITSAGKDIYYPRAYTQGKGELMLTWTQFDQYGSDQPVHKSTIMLSRSKDGKKWTDPMQVTQIAGDCRDGDETAKGATPASNNRDMMFVAWAINQKIYLDRSFNKGEMWLTNDIFVADQPGGWTVDVPGLTRANGLPTLLVDNSPGTYNGAMYIGWCDERNGSSDTDIWFIRSVNFGDNWSIPMRINDDEKGKHQFAPAFAIDQTDGSIYAAYFDRRNSDDEQTHLYLAYSTDNGSTFKNVKVSESPFQVVDSSGNSSSLIGIDAHRGRIVLVWTSLIDGNISVKGSVIEKDDLVKPETAAKQKSG